MGVARYELRAVWPRRRNLEQFAARHPLAHSPPARSADDQRRRRLLGQRLGGGIEPLGDEQPSYLPNGLAPGRRYEAQIYADAPGADHRTNPHALRVERRIVTSRDRLVLDLAPGGGAAIRFKDMG